MLRCYFWQCDIDQNCSKVRDWLSNDEVPGQRDDKVALIFADADAGWVDERSRLTVVVCVFHVCKLLKYVNGFGIIPFSHQDLKRGDFQNSGEQGFLSRSG